MSRTLPPANSSSNGRDAGPSASHSEGGFDPWQFLGLLRRYAWAVLACAVLLTLAVAFWTLRQPKIYEAVCTLEYDPNPPKPLGREVEDVDNPMSNPWASREWYQTQNRIIGSRAVAERVVRKLGLHRNPDFFRVPKEQREEWEPVSVERAANYLQSKVDVQQIKDTRIVELSVRDTDPERAKTLANTLADTFIDKKLEDRLSSTVDALDWLSKQLDEQRKDLRESELALHEFKRENNVLSLSLEDRQNIVANNIERFSESLTEIRTKRIELEARLEELRRANQKDPLEVSVALVSDHPALEELREAYREQVAERNELTVTYGESHPKVTKLNARIETLREQITDEVSGLLEGAESDLREVQATEQGMREALNEAHEAGLDLNRKEIEYDRLQRQRENNENLHEMLMERTTQTGLTRMLRISYIRIVDRALAPRGHVSPNLPLNLGMGSAAGLAMGVFLALLLARMDRTLKSAEDVEALGITALGIMPGVDADKKAARPKLARKRRNQDRHARDLIVHTHPKSALAECCRTIRTNLTFMSAEKPLNTVVVTSPSPLEGKTMVSISLAITLAKSGKRVLLVDTDLRKPRVHRAFGIPSARGVTTILAGERSFEEVVVQSEVEHLDVMACGPIPPNPSELLHTERFRAFLADIAERYDHVILDSPPLGAVTDAAIVAPQVDGTIVVLRSQKTTRDAAASALRQLRSVAAPVLGAIINDVDMSRRGYGYGSYYYYQYGGYYGVEDETPESKHASDALGNGNGRPHA